jgi:hypothetical protein
MPLVFIYCKHSSIFAKLIYHYRNSALSLKLFLHLVREICSMYNKATLLKLMTLHMTGIVILSLVAMMERPSYRSVLSAGE